MQTPSEIIELSEPIESLYAQMVDDLLVNIGKHLTGGTAVWTAYWETEKLAEIGQLTAENAAIINGYIKALPDELKETLEMTRRGALHEMEQKLRQAVQDGFLPPPVTDKVTQILSDYGTQATDKYNMVNTTMLDSSVQLYRQGISDTAEEMRLQEQKKETQRILNQSSGNVAVGVDTMRAAVRKSILRISSDGLTGFYDRAGRAWTPEAYVNMVTRTTVHNVAIQSYRARSEDYGANVFQVSSHAGARPLCYPWQGKFLSWDNTSGTVELGDGRAVAYEPISNSSYGDPAGLFGINCGHYPIIIIPGVTIPHGADFIQPKEANDELYAQMQQQRALEREVRYAKRDLEMLGNHATEDDRKRVRDAQADLRAFTKESGLARRRQNEQIVS